MKERKKMKTLFRNSKETHRHDTITLFDDSASSAGSFFLSSLYINYIFFILSGTIFCVHIKVHYLKIAEFFFNSSFCPLLHVVLSFSLVHHYYCMSGEHAIYAFSLEGTAEDNKTTHIDNGLWQNRNISEI